jgi:hypothetical protein
MDECTRYVFSKPLVTKDKAAEGLLCTMKRAHVLHTHRIKCLHTDQGGEFQSSVLGIAKEELGIEAEIVPARCRESNGLIERVNRRTQEKVRALLIAAFWSEAVLHAGHLYNLTPQSALRKTDGSINTPHSAYMQDSPERLQRLYDQLILFGTLCKVTLTDEHLPKLAPRSTPAVVVGTGPSTSHYRVVLLTETKLKVSVVRHITVSTAQQHEILTRTTGPFGTTRKGNTSFVPTTVRTVQVNTIEPLPLTVPSMPSLSHYDTPSVCSTIHGSQPSTPDGKRGKGSSQCAPGSGDSADQANRRSICGKNSIHTGFSPPRI